MRIHSYVHGIYINTNVAESVSHLNAATFTSAAHCCQGLAFCGGLRKRNCREFSCNYVCIQILILLFLHIVCIRLAMEDVSTSSSYDMIAQG